MTDRKAYFKEYTEKNKQKIKEQKKEYYEINKEKIKERKKEYREANKEQIKEYRKEYYEINKEKIKERKKEYREANKEQIKEHSKEYSENHKEQRKEYYEKNKEQIKEKRKEYIKEYSENHKEQRKEYSKEYRENNKEKIKEYCEANKQKIKEQMKEYTKCRSCKLFQTRSKTKYLCSYCNPDKPTRQKTKEMRVKTFLEECNYKFIHNRKCNLDGSCQTYYPDFLIDCNTFFLIIECDEDAHKSYPIDCEKMRENNICYALGLPCVFLRFNPDKKKVKMKVKEKVLKSYIEYYMNRESMNNEVQYLFY